MFVSGCGGCSCRSTPPTASSSSSRRGTARSARPTPLASSSRSPPPRRQSRARCSTRSSTGDARLQWRGASVGLADAPGCGRRSRVGHVRRLRPRDDRPLAPRLAHRRDRGAAGRGARLHATTFETLVDPGQPLPAAITALTGIGPGDVRGAPREDMAVRRFLAFAGDAVLVAHNARFDMAFLDHAVSRLTGRRVAAPVVDTVWLARRLLEGRTRHFGLARLAHFFGTSAEPCHRALPDAAATAEILIALIGLAQERGAETVADLVELSAPRARRLHAKRSLVAGAPRWPGHVSLSGRPRAAALRGAGARPLGAPALLLLRRAAAARGGGGPRSARGGRVAAVRERARGGARGAAPPA